MIAILRSDTYALSEGRFSIIQCTMQGLCLDNNKRQEAMNGYFAKPADGDIIQTPVSLQPTENTLNRASSAVDCSPFLGLREQCLFVSRIHFDNWLSPILMFDNKPQFLTAVASITNDVVRIESTTGISRLGENTGGNTDIAQTSTRDIGNYSENRLID